MKSFLSLLFVFSILLASCKKELEPQQSTTPTNVVPFTEVGKQMQNQSAISSQVQQDPNMANQNKALATPAPVAKGMNPAHGQPGHRCDIPVGAPLNSPVATAKNTPVIQPVSTNPVTSAPTVTTPTPEGMNPPHGQTNHRCDIAVGAPLPKS